MLKKKILGAKVLDTNGYVLATRLITPVKRSGKYLLGDILNAEAVDLIITKAINEHNTDKEYLEKLVSDSVSDAKKEIVAGASEDYDTLKEVADYILAHKEEYTELADKVDKLSKSTGDINTAIKDAKLSGSYDKTTNKLSLTLAINGVNVSTEIDLGEVIDSDDLADSDTTTVERENGKSKTNVNILSEDEVNNLIDELK